MLLISSNLALALEKIPPIPPAVSSSGICSSTVVTSSSTLLRRKILLILAFMRAKNPGLGSSSSSSCCSAKRLGKENAGRAAVSFSWGAHLLVFDSGTGVEIGTGCLRKGDRFISLTAPPSDGGNVDLENGTAGGVSSFGTFHDLFAGGMEGLGVGDHAGAGSLFSGKTGGSVFLLLVIGGNGVEVLGLGVREGTSMGNPERASLSFLKAADSSGCPNGERAGNSFGDSGKELKSFLRSEESFGCQDG